MKVGDIVKIKENLEVKKRYGSEFFVYSMKEYCGKQARITYAGVAYCLDIDNERWNWTDEMLELKEEIKMKFKVGETVKIKEGLNYKNAPDFIDDMEEYCGKKAKIVEITESYYKLDIDNKTWFWTDDMLEPISSKKYEVIVNGNTVIVKDDKGNKGIAKCSPEDEFNLSTGISLAISRLRWKPSLGEWCFSICLASKNPVNWCTWVNDSFDNNYYERGLVFKTKEEAEKVAKIILDSIRER